MVLSEAFGIRIPVPLCFSSVSFDRPRAPAAQSPAPGICTNGPPSLGQLKDDSRASVVDIGIVVASYDGGRSSAAENYSRYTLDSTLVECSTLRCESNHCDLEPPKIRIPLEP